MKRFLAIVTVLLMCIASRGVFAQDNQEVKSISQLHQQTVYLTSAGLRLTDSEALGGPYGNNEDFIATFYDTVCSTPNRLSFTIVEFGIHPSDTLYVYDGPNTCRHRLLGLTAIGVGNIHKEVETLYSLVLVTSQIGAPIV